MSLAWPSARSSGFAGGLTAAAAVLLVGTTALVARTAWAAPSRPAAARTTAADPDAAGELLARAAAAGDRASYDGRLALVAFDAPGPTVAELNVSQDRGDLRVSHGESWTLGRQGAEGFYRRAGSLLRLGSVEAHGLDLDLLVARYDPVVEGTRDLDTGPARAVAVVDRETRTLRERLFVDEATGLIVRRETYREDGTPTRLAAFTELRVREHPLGDLPSTSVPPRGLTRLSPEELASLRAEGWRVPLTLPDGLVLRGGYALPEADGASVHLVYSDGLYTLSLYEQDGWLDTGALRGAVELAGGDLQAYHWPGSEPDRLVWSGAGLTFTLVSDAPDDVLTEVVAELPHRRDPSLLARFGRGLDRIGSWLWPF